MTNPTVATPATADPVDYTRPTMAQVRAALAALHQPPPQRQIRPAGRITPRAGYTKRHGQGVPTEYALGDSVKAKRKQAAMSRRQNRKK